MLALRTKLDPNASFKDVLIYIRSLIYDAFSCEQAPFDKLVSEIAPKRLVELNPLFQVMFTLHGDRGELIKKLGICKMPIRLNRKASKFDLSLSLTPHGDRIFGNLEYRTDLFEKETILQWIDWYACLLKNILRDESQKISEIRYLSNQQIRKIESTWNRTNQLLRPTHRCIHDYLSLWAEQRPDAVALQFDSVQISYAALDYQVRQLATRLQQEGVKPDVVVGIYAERSIEMVVGIWAVLVAGGAFAAIDPAFPQERVRILMSEAAMELVLTQDHLVGQLEGIDARVLNLNAGGGRIQCSQDKLISYKLDENSLAYIIYTSGTTGTPKGAANTHGGIRNRIEWMQATFKLDQQDRVLQKTPFSFDVSVWEFLWPIATGSTLIIAKPQGHLDREYLVDAFRQHGITTVHFVPSMLRIFLESPRAHACNTLKTVICSGEALAVELSQSFHEKLQASLYNLYGPAEAAIDVSFYHDDKVTEHRRPIVSIGRPIWNTRIYLLDEHFNTTGPGVMSELYIAGENVGRGYLGRPSLTAEKFLPDIHCPGERMYRTGDGCSFDKSGDIHYHDRLDNQVKVNGIRIELGEIESVLEKHDTIAQAAVVVEQQNVSHRRLLAYVVATSEKALDLSKLRNYLAYRLPDYMIPSLIYRIEVMPLSSNGKIARGSLRNHDAELLVVRHEVDTTPEGRIENALVSIYSQLLEVETVSVLDNFFQIGGDSILAILLASRAREHDIFISVKDIYESQTIRRLAELVDSRDSTRGMVEGINFEPFFLTPIQKWFFDLNLNNRNHFNQSALFELRTRLNGDSFNKVCCCIASFHDILRVRFRQVEGAWLQSYQEEIDIRAFEYVDLSKIEDGEVNHPVLTHAHREQEKLDIENGPLYRMVYYRGHDESADRLLLVVHHLIIDRLSWYILIDEINRLCRQIADAEPLSLGAKTTSYQAWSNHLEGHALGPALEGEIEFWNRYLKESDTQGQPFADSEKNIVRNTKRLSKQLKPCETKLLMESSEKYWGVDLEIVLLASVIGALVESGFGGDTFAVDIERNGRFDDTGDRDFTRTMGWFTALFPFVVSSELGKSGNSSGMDEMALIKKLDSFYKCLKAGGIGFGIKRYLMENADGVEFPDASVLFNYLGIESGAFKNEGQIVVKHDGAIGNLHDENNQRTHGISFNIQVKQGACCVEVGYSTSCFDEREIQSLTEKLLSKLSGYIRSKQSCLVEAALSEFSLPEENRVVIEKEDDLESVEDLYPLSPLQHGILLQSLMSKQADVYHGQIVCRGQGVLNVEAFCKAWQGVIADNDILRASFLWKHLTEPMQKVGADVELPFDVRDWTARICEDLSESVDAIIWEQRNKPFDLEKAPLMRIVLVLLPEDKFVFVWDRHHLILDGWSISIVLHEVMVHYDHIIKEVDPRNRIEKPKFKDFIIQQRREDYQSAKMFWRSELRNFQEQTALCLQLSRSRKIENRIGKKVVLEIDVDETEQLVHCSRQNQVTLNVVFQLAWAGALQKFSGASRVAFGMVLSGRASLGEQSEKMVGMLINTLPLVVDVDEGKHVKEKLLLIQKKNHMISQCEHVPINKLYEWCDVPRNASLFESVLIYQNYPSAEKFSDSLGAFKINAVEGYESSSYPLFIDVCPGSSVEIKFNYHEALISSSTIQRLADLFKESLQEISAKR